jgi:hypothetical protein
MNAWGRACAICVFAVMVMAVAYVVTGSGAGTYGRLSDSERVSASVAAALDFGGAPAMIDSEPETVSPTIVAPAATPTPVQTATAAPTAAVAATPSPTPIPTASPIPSPTPILMPSPTPSATPAPAPGGVFVSVTCQGQPVAGAEVRVSHQAPGEALAWSGGTGDDGEFCTGLVLDAGSYLVDILKQGTSYDSVIATVPAGGYAPVYAQCTVVRGFER